MLLQQGLTLMHPSVGKLVRLATWLVLFFVEPRLTEQELGREQALVERARHDPAAFGELYEQNYDLILNFVVRRTASVEMAQDITAETFIKAFKKMSSFAWQGVPFKAWLYRIALHEIGQYRRKHPGASLSLDELQEKGFDPLADQNVLEELLAAETELERHTDFLAVQSKMQELPLKYREVIFLRFFGQLPLQEIATILDKPTGTIKSLLHRGLEKLQQMLVADQKSATKSHDQHYKV